MLNEGLKQFGYNLIRIIDLDTRILYKYKMIALKIFNYVISCLVLYAKRKHVLKPYVLALILKISYVKKVLTMGLSMCVEVSNVYHQNICPLTR